MPQKLNFAPTQTITLGEEETADVSDAGADVCLLSCTAIKSALVIAQLEKVSGLPVLTSNQSMAWHLLRSSGIDDRIDAYGRLFSI